MGLTLNIGGSTVAQVQTGVLWVGAAQPSLPTTSSSGNCLVAILSNVGGAATTTAPAGWVKAVSQDAAGVAHIEVWVYPNNPGGITIATWQNNNAAVQWYTHMSEWSNVSTVFALDGGAGTLTATSGTTLAPTTSANLVSSGDLAISCWAQSTASAAESFTSPAGFTRLIADSFTGTQHLDAEYKINPATGATLGPTLTSNLTTVSAAGVIICLTAKTPAVDQTAFLAYGSVSVKFNTADFALLDPATVPLLGDPVTFSTPSWTGRVVSLTKADIVNRASGHKLVTIAATNQTVVNLTPSLARSGSIVQESTSTTIIPSLPAASSAGTTLIAVVGNSAGKTTTGPAGWVKLAGLVGLGAVAGFEVWAYLLNPGGVSSATFTFSGALGTAHGNAHMSEWNNVAALDVSGTATSSLATTLSPVTGGNVGAANELAIAGWELTTSQVATTFTSPSGWTRLVDNGSITGAPATPVNHIDVEYLINPPSGATLGPTLTATAGANNAGVIVVLKAGTPAAEALIDSADAGYRLLLEDGSGALVLEDGSGYLLLENAAASYTNLSVKTSQNSDGSLTTAGSLQSFQSGFAVGQTFNLTSANLGYSAQPFVITNITTTWQGLPGGTTSQQLQAPVYTIEFGDPYMTMQTVGGGVLTQLAGQASTQGASGTVMPAGTLGFAQFTGVQTGITTETDITGLSVNVSVVAGRRVRITGFLPQTDNSVGATWGEFRIYEDATAIQSADIEWVATTSEYAITAIAVRQPTAGVHTYKLRLNGQKVGAGTARIPSSATAPSFILVEDIGT